MPTAATTSEATLVAAIYEMISQGGCAALKLENNCNIKKVLMMRA